MRHVTLHLLGNVLHIIPNKLTVTGLWIGSIDTMTIEGPLTFIEIGKAVIKALEMSHGGVAHPDNWKAFQKELQLAWGVKSWKKYYEGSKCVTILEDGRLELRPMKNMGTNRGYAQIEDRKTILHIDSDPEEIGEEVMRQFDIAE